MRPNGICYNYVPGHVVGIDECEESLWEGEGVAGEGGQLPVRRLTGQDAQELTQLLPPLLTQRYKVLAKNN